MTGYTVVIGCDNKAVIARNGPSDYRMMYAPRLGTPSENMEALAFVVSEIGVTPCLPTISYSVISTAVRASNTPWSYGNCSSTQLSLSTVNPPDSAVPPAGALGGAWNTSDPHLLTVDGLSPCLDDIGRHYLTIQYRGTGTAPDFRNAMVRSTDDTQTAWETILDLGPVSGLNISLADHPGNLKCIFAKGYLWYISVGSNSLYRVDISSPSVTSFTIPWSSGDIRDSAFNALNPTERPYHITGYTPGLNVLFAYPYNSVYRASDSALKAAPLLRIDITDPNSPLLSFSGFEPFGHDMHVGHIQGFDNNTFVAKVFHQLPEGGSTPFLAPPQSWDKGEIFRTTNSGVTWSSVKALDVRLGASLNHGFISSSSTFRYDIFSGANQQVAIADTSTVFVCGAPPYVYRSDDRGVTWNEEVVDLSIFTPYIVGASDEAANQFDSIVICRSCPPQFPGLSRFNKATGTQDFFLPSLS